MKTIIPQLGTGLIIAMTACSGNFGTDSNYASQLPFAEGSPKALAVLALVNDQTVTYTDFDQEAHLDQRAAYGIVIHRDGTDGLPGTDDDDSFASLQQLDSIDHVGPYAMQQLFDYAELKGYYTGQLGKQLDVVFSPQNYQESHLVRTAELIDQAARSIDIAMYSYSDGGIADALERAISRGVRIRFIFESANKDKNKTDSALANSKSGKLEQLGINVRYINKIMHHKFMIVDGPRDEYDDATTATVVTGSGNWSHSAGTRYDENTLFFSGYPELSLRLQGEFNHMWEHSRDFVYDASLLYTWSNLKISPEDIPDNPNIHAWFTSANFKLSNDTTFSITGSNEVADELVRAISEATQSIYIASGHMRSRPIAQALMTKMAENPSLDVRILLDGQEYISSWKSSDQQYKLKNCLEEAGTSESAQRDCLDKGYYFGYDLAQAGADVHYKYYAYRWHYTYAEQMHHKYLLIDNNVLYTGSYNLSDNAEHNTFENMLMFRGPEFFDLLNSFADNFTSLWSLGEHDDRLGQLVDQIVTSDTVPLVFDSMALPWQQITDLKALIKANCPSINDDDFRNNPEDHLVCYK